MKFYIFVEVHLKMLLCDTCEQWASCHLYSFGHHVNDLLSYYKSMKHQATGRRKFEFQVVRKHGYAITPTIIFFCYFGYIDTKNIIYFGDVVKCRIHVYAQPFFSSFGEVEESIMYFGKSQRKLYKVIVQQDFEHLRMLFNI